jgi:hypothetical protein
LKTLRYDNSLWEQVKLKNPESVVAALCRPPADSFAGSVARVLENWAALFDLPKTLLQQLKSSDDDQFWSGYFHLKAARVYHELGFAVDLRAQVGPKTPDILVSRGSLNAMVEVFAVLPSAEDRAEAQAMDAIATVLRDRAEIPPGNLSISLMLPNRSLPSTPQQFEFAKRVKHAVSTGKKTRMDINVDGLNAHGFFIPDSSLDPAAIFVTPPGGAIGESGRIYRRLGQKLTRYAPYVTDDIGLIVAVGALNWKVTPHGLETALYGAEQVTLSSDLTTASDPGYSGLGAAVVGGPVGYDQASKLWGVLYMERGAVEEARPAIEVSAAFLYNPYAENPLPSGSFQPLSEHQVGSGGLSWVRDTQGISMWLN